MADQPVAIRSALQLIWRKNLPQTRERLALLERTLQAMDAGSLDDALRGEAHSTAHKLAGSLGMFGHGTASQHARSLEHLLQPEGTADVAGVREHLQALHASLDGALEG